MRKIAVLTLALICALGISACNDEKVKHIQANEPITANGGEVEKETSYFEGKILEIHQNSVLVEPLQGEWELNSADKIEVNTVDTNIEFNLIVGDIIGITYNGEILETYPAQITGVVSMVFLEPAVEAETPKRMVLIDGTMYYDTGKTNNFPRCGVMDGRIESSVEPSEIPTENYQSNFGDNYGYQLGFEKDTIEVLIGEDWCVFKADK